MRVGTKSLLFGVHAVWFHPFVVVLAWRRRYKRWPNFYESIAILVHDWNYWGKPNMDGPEGKQHPKGGAEIMFQFVRRCEALRGNGFRSRLTERKAYKYHWLVLGHSRWMAERCGHEPSALCNPDKESVLFEPRWFYLLRATFSGEINEYRAVAIRAGKILPSATNGEWFDWFRNRVAARAQSLSWFCRSRT